MTLRWSEIAGEDLDAIYDYIVQDKPGAAAATIERIMQAAEQLTNFPQIGRAGGSGTRRLILPPFTIVYRIKGDVINIETILPGARI